MPDAYFDTHTYIAGPGEVKYIQELDPVYEFQHVRKANVVPCPSLCLNWLYFLKKHAIDLQDALLLEKPKLVKKVLKEQTGFDYKDLTQKSRQLTKEYLTAVQRLGVNISKWTLFIWGVKEDLGEQRAREKARLERTLKDAEMLSDLLKPFGKTPGTGV